MVDEDEENNFVLSEKDLNKMDLAKYGKQIRFSKGFKEIRKMTENYRTK